MLNKITSAPKKVANHVVRHRVAYTSATSFAAGMALMRKLDADTYGAAIAFIEEKGLREEFFLTPEDL